ncbi:MAG: DUF58 domain-containing protein [Proteobacteria bacterium]|nr:DUF58 domain-containing protein [Pseudomonadota bacterium]
MKRSGRSAGHSAGRTTSIRSAGKRRSGNPVAAAGRILFWIWHKIRPPRRLKFTREGRYFVAITVGIGLAAINTGNNLLYLLLGWLLSVIIASGALSDVSMRGLRVRRRPPPRIFADRPFLMEISVENCKDSLSSYSIEIEDLVDRKPLDKKCYFLKVPPGRTQRTSYRHTFPRRGIYEFTGFRIGTKFPFALFHKSRDVGESEEVLAYPAVYPVPPPAPRAQNPGGTTATQIGRRGEFFGLREYRDGDDRRDIHWRSSARTGRLLVREYEEESQKQVAILIDNALSLASDSDQPDDRDVEALERAISLAASLASTYIGMDYVVKLMARGAHLPFSAGQAQLTRILRTLALLPTVTEAIRFSGTLDPRLESVLVVPKGVDALPGRPTEVSHVLQPD